MMFKNLIKIASSYGARSNFNEIVRININQTKSYPVAISNKLNQI